MNRPSYETSSFRIHQRRLLPGAEEETSNSRRNTSIRNTQAGAAAQPEPDRVVCRPGASDAPGAAPAPGLAQERGARRGCRQSWGPSPSAWLPRGSGRWGWEGAGTAWSCSMTPPTPVVTMCPPGPSKGHCPGTRPPGRVQDPHTGGTHSGLWKDALTAGRARPARRVRAGEAEVPPPQADGRCERARGGGCLWGLRAQPEMLPPAGQHAVAMAMTGAAPNSLPVPLCVPVPRPTPRTQGAPGAPVEGGCSSPA